jgi:hypothetical protein
MFCQPPCWYIWLKSLPQQATLQPSKAALEASFESVSHRNKPEGFKVTLVDFEESNRVKSYMERARLLDLQGLRQAVGAWEIHRFPLVDMAAV